MGKTISAGKLEFFVENRAVGEDGGPSIQVLGPIDGKRVQLLRFDMFYKGPHYHYDPEGKNIRYDVDPLTVDDGIGWVMQLFDRKLPQLIERAGYPDPNDATSAKQLLGQIEQTWRSEEPPSR